MNVGLRPIGSSKADLAVACSYWLRDDVEWSAEEPGENLPRDIGIAFHELVSRALGGTELDRYHAVSAEARGEAMKRFRGWMEAWPEQNLEVVETEKVYVVDVEHGTFWDFEGDFMAWRQKRRAWEIPVIIDLLVRSPDGELGVIDIKTGQDLRVSPNRSAQLLLGAHVTGAAWVGFHYITESGSIRQRAAEVETRSPHHQDTPTARMLDELRQRLRDRGIADPPSKHDPYRWARPGEHCTKWYCPALNTCPAVAKQVADLIPLSALSRRAPGKPAQHFGLTSPESLLAARNAIKMGKRLLDNLDAATKCYAAECPELPGGKVFSPKMQSKPRFNKGAYLEALDEYKKTHPDMPDMRDEHFNETTSYPVWRERKA